MIKAFSVFALTVVTIFGVTAGSLNAAWIFPFSNTPVAWMGADEDGGEITAGEGRFLGSFVVESDGITIKGGKLKIDSNTRNIGKYFSDVTIESKGILEEVKIKRNGKGKVKNTITLPAGVHTFYIYGDVKDNIPSGTEFRIVLDRGKVRTLDGDRVWVPKWMSLGLQEFAVN